MKHIGLDLRFQDGYDMEVAGGVVRYARSKSDWILRGQGPWFSFKEDLSECDGLIARIESKEVADEVRGYRSRSSTSLRRSACRPLLRCTMTIILPENERGPI